MSGIQVNNGGNGVNYQLWRNSTNILGFAIIHGYINLSLGSLAATVESGGGTTALDSPATTSSVSYTVYFAPNTNGQSVTTQANGAVSTITLMEIAG